MLNNWIIERMNLYYVICTNDNKCCHWAIYCQFLKHRVRFKLWLKVGIGYLEAFKTNINHSVCGEPFGRKTFINDTKSSNFFIPTNLKSFIVFGFDNNC